MTYSHELFAVFREAQPGCPECGSQATGWELGELVNGGGNHQSDALHCWCEDCDYEWYEPPFERD